MVFWEEDIRISNLYLKSMTVFGMSEKLFKVGSTNVPTRPNLHAIIAAAECYEW